MKTDTRIIVCDIGGTYVRFACSNGGEAPQNIQKYAAADFTDLGAALTQYCNDQSIAAGGALRIATAGYSDNGIWKFVNQNQWHINPEAIRAGGWDITHILNDFEAATWTLNALNDDDRITIKPAKGASDSKCLLGAGTGLGLGYLHQTKSGAYVQKTHGGHLPIAGLNDEQAQVIKHMREEINSDGANRALVFENIASGPGLQALRKHHNDATALRLFHEFLGIFAATCVVAGNAYGGLYLSGGVIESLSQSGDFDIGIFEKSFCIAAVDSVHRDLCATPIHILKDPYPALKGLLNA